MQKLIDKELKSLYTNKVVKNSDGENRRNSRHNLKEFQKNSLTIIRNDDTIEKLLRWETAEQDEEAAVIEKRIVP